jgi:hypothetical protein
VLTHTGHHACNTYEAFPLKCRVPSDDGRHWLKQGLILLLKTLLYLMEFNPNCIYTLILYNALHHLSSCYSIFRIVECRECSNGENYENPQHPLNTSLGRYCRPTCLI